MIKKASTLIVEFWIKNAIIKTDDKESYCYGMELILSTLINVAFMVILSYYVIGYPIAFIPYIAVYTPLRLTAGGYHARSHLKCILYTQIITDADAFSCSRCNSFEMLTIVQNHE